VIEFSSAVGDCAIPARCFDGPEKLFMNEIARIAEEIASEAPRCLNPQCNADLQGDFTRRYCSDDCMDVVLRNLPTEMVYRDEDGGDERAGRGLGQC
jgi:hypothetical protein